MSAALGQLAELVRRETGISLGEVQLPALQAAVRRVDPGLGAEAFLRGDRGEDRRLLERLVDEVTVNETFFFRQRRELEAIDWSRLHEVARASGRAGIRIWVAACSTGEEAYTLAMLAAEAFRGSDPPVSILATDISRAVLDKARQARYGTRSVRGLDPVLRRRYCLETPDGLELAPQVRDLVEFRRHNLVTDPPPAADAGSFDLITCRNVLIYFDGETVGQVIGSLERGLAPGGMLLLGAADRLCGSARLLADPGGAPGEPARPPVRGRPLRRPLGHEPAVPGPSGEPAPARLADALEAANEGRLDATLELTERLLDADPLDADAHFVRGLAELRVGDPASAAASLRRALYVDPDFGLAAFQLGRAHDESGDAVAARRAYEQALRTLEPGDVAAACAMRLKALRSSA